MFANDIADQAQINLAFLLQKTYQHIAKISDVLIRDNFQSIFGRMPFRQVSPINDMQKWQT